MFKNLFAFFAPKKRTTIPVAKEFLMDFSSTMIVFWSIDRKVKLETFSDVDKKAIKNWLKEHNFHVEEYFETVV